MREATRRTLLCLVVVAILIGAVPVSAITSTNITVDGVFTDWSSVFSDSANMSGDPIGPADPDGPASNRDINKMGYTWDSQYAYFYARRTTTGSNSLEYLVYVDRDADSRLTSTDMVIDFSFNGNAYQAKAAGLYYYSPASPGGDAIAGDGVDQPGKIGAPVTLGASDMSGAGGADGLEIEGRVSWKALGLSPGSPINTRWATALNLTLPGSIEDNCGPFTTVYRGITLEPNGNSGVSAGNTATYTHTLSNTGNTTETVSLALTSQHNWTTYVRLQGGGSDLTTVSVPPHQSVNLVVSIVTPANVVSGTKDSTTLKATLLSDSAVTASVTDETSIGSILAIPDLTGSMAPSQTINYVHTVTNNSSTTRTVGFSATSSQKWTVGVYTADGLASLTTTTLAPYASIKVMVKVQVPPTATIGTQDVTTLVAQDLAEGVAKAGRATATTTVRAGLAVDPDRDIPGAPGTYVWYQHTVSNSWPTTRTISLSVANSAGWAYTLFDASKQVTTSTVTLGPNGASAELYLRVSIPTTATEGASSVSTITGVSGTYRDTAVDKTTARKLSTYADSGHASPSTRFHFGETVYARAGGLTFGTNVTFTWLDGSGNTVYTSTAIPVDSQGAAWSYSSIPTNTVPGTWTIILKNGTTEITRTTFTVDYYAFITALSINDVSGAYATGTVESTVTNAANGTLPASKTSYLMWWDADGSGTYNAGDTYVDSAGNPHTFSTSGDVSYVTSIPALAPYASYRQRSWSVNTTAFPYSGDWHLTQQWLTSDDIPIDTKSITFPVKLSELSITVERDSVDFGNVDPGTVYDSGPVDVVVVSNRRYDLYESITGGASQMGLMSTLGNRLDQAPGPMTYQTRFLIQVPWTTTPGPVNATVTYSAVAR